LFREINGYQLARCRQCALVYLNPRPTQQEINEEYSAEYHIERLLRQEPKTEEEIEEEVNKNIGRVEEILREFGQEGKLLDIGCGAGFFIACLRRYGWNVTGIDISEWASKFAREKLRLNILAGSIEDMELNERFDVITMYHVLEHLVNPLAALRKVLQVLDKDGVLAINGPNLASFDRIWHGKNWRGYALRTHLYYFMPKTYRMILAKAGFSVQKIRFEQWDPIAHLMGMRLGDSIRADHSPEATKRVFDSNIKDRLIFKGVNRIGYSMARLLNLKGRDLTIYAKKKKEVF